MKKKLGWEQVQKGDIVDIIVLSSGSQLNPTVIDKVKSYIESLELIPRVSKDLYQTKEKLIAEGYDPFCANSDEVRLANFEDAINSDSKAIWAIAGGYGAARLIEGLKNITPPEVPKLFIGFSDITVLHIFLQNEWDWPTIHGDVLYRLINSKDEASKRLIEHILFNPNKIIYTDFIPLNEQAKNNQMISAEITGGNLTLVEASIGTDWQVDCNNKIVFLEEVDERGYRVDRSLEHLIQSRLLEGAKAIILGEFTPGYEKNGENYINYAIKRFVNKLKIPVVLSALFGHNDSNYPLPFGTECQLLFGDNIELICSTGVQV